MRNGKRQNKIPQLFKLPPKMVTALTAKSEKSGMTKTKIVERALQMFLATKEA